MSVSFWRKRRANGLKSVKTRRKTHARCLIEFFNPLSIMTRKQVKWVKATTNLNLHLSSI